MDLVAGIKRTIVMMEHASPIKGIGNGDKSGLWESALP